MTGVFTGPLKITTTEPCGKVNLSWSVLAPATVTGSDVFNVEVKIGDGSWGKATSNGTDATVSYTSGTADYSFTYEIPEADMNKEYVNYEFRVKWKFAGWDDDTKKAYQRNKSTSIYTNHRVLSNISITSGTNNYPVVSWNMSGGIWCKDKISLTLRIDGRDTKIDKDNMDGWRNYQVPSTGSGVVGCTKQRYELVLQYGSLPEVTYPVSENYVYQPIGKREFDTIFVSKGYYSDRINITWYLRRDYDEFDGFRVLRKKATEPDDKYVAVQERSHARGVLQYDHNDYDVNAGVYYRYKIEGYSECDESVSNLATSASVGFSQPYGSVSGRITYTGSQAVKDVQIGVYTSNALSGNRELELSDGNSVSIPANAALFSREGFSLQFWLKPTGNGEETILENSLLKIARAADGKISFIMGDRQVTLPEAIDNGVYSHLTFTAEKSGDYKNYKVSIYLNDTIKVEPQAITLDGDAETPVAATTVGGSFSGYIDDIRIWSKILTLEEIALNYDRVLSGIENNLEAYYKCDEADAAEDALFDCSADENDFNGNHATKSAGVRRADVPVTATHLTIKGVTDKDGNYTILNSIPYTSKGTLYSLVPMFGIHQFDPAGRPLYFSPESKVFNNIDFTDVSSFPVSGQIVYAGTNYPVKEVQIAIDGAVANKDGKMIETDEEGNFEVEVPIGSHFITVSKQGHVFANEGRFPENPLLKHNFQNSINGMVFTDQTTVRLTGRVAGGQPQADLPLGFGLSKANIGQATITLVPTNSRYSLNLTAIDSTVDNNRVGDTTSTTVFRPGSVIEITTSPATGEFLAVLPPVPYNITKVRTKDYEDNFTGAQTEFSYSKMTFDINPSSEQTVEHTDTAGVTREFIYNDSLKIIRYNEPVIHVVDLGAAPGAFGDSVYVYRNTVLDIRDTIRLYSVQPDGHVNYTFGYPLFTQKKSLYTWDISTYEEYLNHDDDKAPVTDIVPLAGQTVVINNALASGYTEFLFANGGEQTVLTASSDSVTLDDDGKRIFSFNAGFPKLGGDHLLAAKLTLDHNGKEIVWNNSQSSGEEFKGYLLGQVVSDGNNFVTQGPDLIDIILCDPPGSNSYAYIDQGSTITTTRNKTSYDETTETGAATIHLGHGVRAIFGVGVMAETELEVIFDITSNFEGKQMYLSDRITAKTFSVTEKISTSADPAFVGSDADIYIGTSNNHIFGQVRQLSFYPKEEDNTGSSLVTSDGKYSLFPKDIVAVGDEFKTVFTYTQGYILNTLIPNTQKLRNALIRYYPGELPQTGEGLDFGSSDVIYLSNLDVNAPNFGAEGTYKVYYAPGAVEHRKACDLKWSFQLITMGILYQKP
jgi:hypothetical protein